jgi:tryptophanyl-tRNA synthetase
MAKEKIILTGDRPTGRLHIGHYVGSLRRRVELQNSGLYDKTFIFIADAQALTDNMDNPEKVRQNVIEVALDYLACGLDPTKSTIFIQSQIPELCELSFYYMDLVTVSRLQRNPTVKTEIQMRNFETSIPVGFFTYPISQAADITALKLKLSQARSKKKNAYTRLGELCYSKHRPRTDDVTEDIEKAISSTVAEITELSQIITELELRIKLVKAEK